MKWLHRSVKKQRKIVKSTVHKITSNETSDLPENNNRTPSRRVLLNNDNMNATIFKNVASGSKLVDSHEAEVDEPVEEQGSLPHFMNDGVQVQVNESEEEEFPDGVSEDDEQEDEDVEEVEQIDDEITLGATANVLNTSAETSTTLNVGDDERDLRLMRLMDKMMDDKLTKIIKSVQAESKGKEKTTPIKRSGKVTNVKSPSDTTLYQPAFKKKVDENGKLMNGVTLQVVSDREKINNDKLINWDTSVSVNMADKGGSNKSGQVENVIANFVDTLRIEHEQKNKDDGSREKMVQRPIQQADEEWTQARDRTDQRILDAERFRATVANPTQGNGDILPPFVQNNNLPIAAPLAMGEGLSDDDFFHLSCHIDDNLRSKITQGAYVDLEKLLPRDRGSNFTSDEGRLEWVFKDGQTFLTPVNQKNGKINSIRKWEQAFRIYATIFCGAHPERSQEILQYVYVINTAASSYQWDNVAHYDYVFRHLMQFNPQRSWAKTYNQMWNLSMKDPLIRQNQNNFRNLGYGSSAVSNQNNQASGSNWSAGPTKNKFLKRSDHCWSFNKGMPCKFGKNCKFIERCSYCDSASHGVYICPKLERKEGGGRPSPSPSSHHGNKDKGAKKN